MATIVTRAGKGSPLTNTELDANFTNLNTEITVDSYPLIRPSLLLDFVNNNIIDLRVTFTRASTATFINATGTLQSAAIDVPRFDYDLVTRAAKGLLIEESRQNLLLQSDTFTTTWINTGNATYTKNVISPDGTANATSIVEDLTTGQRTTRQDVTSTGSSTHCLTMYAKPLGVGSQRYLGVRMANAASSTTNYFQAAFDINNGTLSDGLFSLGDATGASATITAAGGGWYRISLVGVPSTSATSVRCSFFIANATASVAPNYTGDGVSGLILWGAQLELGDFPTSYIPTTTTALTRAADVAQVNTLSPWFNASEGTLYAQATVPSVVLANRYMVNLGRSTGTAQDIELGISRSADTRRVSFINNGTNQFSYTPPVAVTSTKGTVAYKTDDSQTAFDGVASPVDTLVSLPTLLTTLYIGNNDSGVANLNGHIQRITYYPRRLSEAELVAITS